jgi:hypothetical protein
MPYDHRPCPDHPQHRASRCLLCHALGRQVSDLCRQHGRQRHQCSECLSLDRLLTKRAFCDVCGLVRTQGRRTICKSCENVAEQSLEQRFLKELLPILDHEASGMLDDLTLGGKVCSTTQRRQDAIWIGAQHAVILEIDEDWHSSYIPSCEATRLQQIHDSLQTLKGPDYKTACLRVGISRLVGSKRDLVERCASILNNWFLNCPNPTPLGMAICFLNYPTEHKHRAYIENAAASLVLI